MYVLGGGYPLVSNGFTLIELLAVIVILAIIALIATPIILGIISDANEESTMVGIRNYIRAVNLTISNENLGEESFEPTVCKVVLKNNQSYIKCDDYEEIVLVEVKGTRPVSGTLLITDGSVRKIMNLKINKYYANTDKNKEIVLSKEEVEYASIPKLSGMTAVVYNGDNWIVADTSEEWYDYTNQEWANAVILKSGVTKNVGDTIDVSSEVKAMFVWIPRYEYKIDGSYGKGGTSETSPGEIEVNFISEDKTEASEGYIIHPAFWWDDNSNNITDEGEQLSGIWIGKFETSPDKSSNCYKNCGWYNDACWTYCNNLDQDPYIIPDSIALRWQTVSNQFQTAQKFNSYITNADSHMMKNSEWGAVAYLSQSKYGKYGNSNYTGANKEIYQNNSIARTGRSGGNIGGNTPANETYQDQTSTKQYNSYGYYTYDGYLLNYNTNQKSETRDINKGTGASTTGNITGIYDVSGGTYDLVMGYLTIASETWGANTTSNSAGFTRMPESKYFDAYITNNKLTACNGGICYGHALSETSGWYSGDGFLFINVNKPWITRGNYYEVGSSCSIFALHYTTGGASHYYSFRVTISPTY